MWHDTLGGRNIISALDLLLSPSLAVGSRSSSHYKVGPTCQLYLPPPIVLYSSASSPTSDRAVLVSFISHLRLGSRHARKLAAGGDHERVGVTSRKIIEYLYFKNEDFQKKIVWSGNNWNHLRLNSTHLYPSFN